MDNICYIILTGGAELISYYKYEYKGGIDQLILTQPHAVNIIPGPQKQIGLHLMLWPPVLALTTPRDVKIKVHIEMKDILVFEDDPPEQLVNMYIERTTDIKVAQSMPNIKM